MHNSWDDSNGKLNRTFVFDNFSQAWAFMSRVALLAERHDHHPDWSNSWNTVTIDLVSHDAGAITEKDRELAAAIDALVRD